MKINIEIIFTNFLILHTIYIYWENIAKRVVVNKVNIQEKKFGVGEGGSENATCLRINHTQLPLIW